MEARWLRNFTNLEPPWPGGPRGERVSETEFWLCFFFCVCFGVFLFLVFFFVFYVWVFFFLFLNVVLFFFVFGDFFFNVWVFF